MVHNKRNIICREPSHERLEIREKYLPRLIDGNNTTGINIFRMNKSTFFNLWSILRWKGLLKDTVLMSVKGQLLIFLHTISHNEHDCIIGHNFLRSSETISKYFNHVLFIISELQHEYIQPQSTQNPPYIVARSTLYPYLKVLLC